MRVQSSGVVQLAIRDKLPGYRTPAGKVRGLRGNRTDGATYRLEPRKTRQGYGPKYSCVPAIRWQSTNPRIRRCHPCAKAVSGVQVKGQWSAREASAHPAKRFWRGVRRQTWRSRYGSEPKKW